jgi:hypothetical protein
MIKALVGSTSKNARIKRSALGKLLLCFTHHGDQLGDRAMQQRRALVLDESVLMYLRVTHRKTRKAQEEEAVKIITGQSPIGGKGMDGYDRFQGALVRADLKEIMANVQTSHELVDKDDLKPREVEFLQAASHLLYDIDQREHGWQAMEKRTLVIGESDMADGWTDGSSYIAINRRFLDGLELGLERDWHKVGHLILHEFCHKGPDTETHNHTPEFYEDYHDGTRDLPMSSRMAYQTYRQNMLRKARKAPRAYMNQLHVEAEAYVNNQLLFARNKEEVANAAV